MIDTNGKPFQLMVIATAQTAAPGCETQGIIWSESPSCTESHPNSPKELSNIQAKMTTAMISGTAHGSAMPSRATVRPRNLLLTRSAVLRPTIALPIVTTTTSFSVTQQASQNSSELNSHL